VTDVVIDNPILNSPYEEPSRHFRFSDEGITDEIAEGRRRSGYFVPVPAARTRQPQLQMETAVDRGPILKNCSTASTSTETTPPASATSRSCSDNSVAHRRQSSSSQPR
jgi:hypothetical protein